MLTFTDGPAPPQPGLSALPCGAGDWWGAIFNASSTPDTDMRDAATRVFGAANLHTWTRLHAATHPGQPVPPDDPLARMSSLASLHRVLRTIHAMHARLTHPTDDLGWAFLNLQQDDPDWLLPTLRGWRNAGRGGDGWLWIAAGYGLHELAATSPGRTVPELRALAAIRGITLPEPAPALSGSPQP